jgi:hypothetical protein
MPMLQLVFIIITLLTFACFYVATGKDKRILWFFTLWILAMGLLSGIGFFLKTDTIPPRIVFVILPVILYVIYFYKTIDTVRLHVPLLIAIHIIRIPVELVLYALYVEGKLPQLMTFEGWNFDVFVGISALLMTVYSAIKRTAIATALLKTWNVVSLIFLSIIVTLAVLSAPLPFQQLAFDQPNVAVLEFPFVFLPAVVVPMILLSHLLLFNVLSARKIKL